MANQYSDFYSSLAQPQATRESNYRGEATRHAGSVQVGVFRMVFDLAPDDFGIGDILRIVTFPSGTRIGHIYVTTPADAATAIAADLGLYRAEGRWGGALLDADLFAAALALDGAVARVDQFTQSTNLGNEHRWRPLWFLADLGTPVYTADPFEEWDIAWTATAAVATADATCTVEIWYQLPYGD